MATKTLREAKHGEKAALVRELLAKHPEKKNPELVELFAEEAARRGIDMAATTMTFSVERSVQKRKAEPATEKATEQPEKPIVKHEAVPASIPVHTTNGVTAIAATVPASAVTVRAEREPTMSDILEVKSAIKKLNVDGAPLSALELFELFDGLLKRVGSSEVVKSCIEFWQENGSEAGE